MINKKEYELAKAVSTYLKLQYPDVLFHFDMQGLNLSKAQAGMNKAIQKGRGWCDLFIAQPKQMGFRMGEIDSARLTQYCGLFIELKTETPYKKNGELKAGEHLENQKKMIDCLNKIGYRATFGVGFDTVKRIIDEYLK